ncbi:MAG: HAD family hydrolase [Candidatus Thermoplasmatota archaeon]|nr:HAD family hydrolase [Candidatus Thermoplasmatota archaeon]
MRNVKIMGFDLDGTLVKMKLDFGAFRKDLQIPKGDTLQYITSMVGPKKKELLSRLEEMEKEAARKAEIAPGARELLELCRDLGMKVVVITRNSLEATTLTLDVLGIEVDMILSREHAAPKPSPEAINIVLDHYGIEPYQMAFVGDYIYDVQAGNRAGVRTILLTSQERADEWIPFADHIAEDLYEVIDMIKSSREVMSDEKG